MTERITLKNLDCALCATRVENLLRKRPDVHKASIDFATLSLDIEADDIDGAMVAIKMAEPDIEIIRKGNRGTRPAGGPQTALAPAGAAPAPATWQAAIKRWSGPVLLALALVILAVSFLVQAVLPGATARLWIVVLAALSWLAAGRGVLWQALRNLRRGMVFDENFLMTLASLGAFALGEVQEAAAVMVFYLIGETLQDRAVDRSRDSIKSLLGLKPDSARLIRRGSGLVMAGSEPAETMVATDSLLAGDMVRVRPGERIPADGVVRTGNAFADTAALTGESLPRNLSAGSEALAGFVVLDGMLDIRVSKPAAESSAARIVAMVENARANKAKTELFITSFARWYTPAVVGLAAATALVLWLLLGFSFGDAVHRALVMLVISCPCALVVSVPLAYFGGVGGAARRGILVKGAAVFDALNRVKAAVFDKTGTLTHGVYEVKSFHPVKQDGQPELLRTAALAEKHSNHPAARAILAASGGSHEGIEVSGYQEIAGFGVSALHAGIPLLAGAHRLLHRENIAHDCVEDEGTRIHIARDGIHLGSIAVGDRIKDDSGSAIRELRLLGVENIVMLTGDTASEADKVGRAAGLDSWRAACLPEDKLAELEKIIAATRTGSRKGAVLFAGDGINDAPVIARADVGVAMGLGGQDAAIESADVVIMNDSPQKVVEAIRIARKTRGIVVQNISFALGIKLLFLAAGGFGLAGMWEAVIADVGVALIAVLNSIRALNYPGVGVSAHEHRRVLSKD